MIIFFNSSFKFLKRLRATRNIQLFLKVFFEKTEGFMKNVLFISVMISHLNCTGQERKYGFYGTSNAYIGFPCLSFPFLYDN